MLINANGTRRRARVISGTVGAAALRAVLVVSMAIGSSACDIVDLHRLEAETSPSSYNEVIGIEEAVTVRFSRAIRGVSGESAFILASEDGELEVDFQRHSDGFDAIPVQRPEPGMRHTLRIEGTVIDERGLDHDMNIYLPFFFGSSREPPRITRIHPSPGADGGVHTPLEFTFSEAMDMESVENTLSLSPDTTVDFDWADGGTFLSVEPRTQWEPVEVYSWSISRSARSSAGVRLASRLEGSFFTQQNSVPPELVELGSMTEADGGYLETPELSANDSLYLRFSEPVRFASVREAVLIEPALAGAIEQLDDTAFIYRTDESIDPDERYTLTVTRDLRDMSGNPPLDEVRHHFAADARRQRVESIDSYWDGDSTSLALDQSPGASAEVGIMQPDGTHRVEIGFLLPFDTKESRDHITEAVSFHAVLPEHSVNPDIERLSWNYDNTVMNIHYAGLVHSRSELEPAVYRLRIASGSASSPENAEGLAEPVIVYLKTEVN